MRKIFTLFTVVMLLISTNSKATHMMGMDISYKCLGNNTYHITLSFYRDCSGAAQAPTSATVDYTSAICGQSG